VAVAAFGDFSMVNLFLFCFFFLYSPPHIFYIGFIPCCASFTSANKKTPKGFGVFLLGAC
jgi:hypothetical protein